MYKSGTNIKKKNCKSAAVFVQSRFWFILCYFLYLFVRVLGVLRFFRASVRGVRCPAKGLWPSVTSQLEWISLRFGRGRADDPVGCPDRSLQVMKQRLRRLPQGSNTTEATLGKTLTSFPTVGKLYCECWQGNRRERTIPWDVYTRMTMGRPSLGTRMKKKTIGVLCQVYQHNQRLDPNNKKSHQWQLDSRII